MHGSYDLANNGFTCSDETACIAGEVEVKYKGNLFLNKEHELEILQHIARVPQLDKTLNALHGQFVFAIFIKKAKTLFLARDHFGVIPLYYTFQNKKLIFSTSISSILHMSTPVLINREVIHEYFTFRYVSGINTFFKDIYEVSPGSLVKIDCCKRLSNWHYYGASYSTENEAQSELSLKNCVNQFESLFWNTLNSQTWDKDEKRIAVLSSGGIDSSILVDCAHRLLGPGFKTYYIGYEDYQHNRTEDVVRLSKIYNTKQTNICISNKEFADNLSKTIRINEEPLNHPSSVARNCLYDKLLGEVDVFLSGEGADCFYGGYHIFSIMKYLYINNPMKDVMSWFVERLPCSIFPKRYLAKYERIKKALVLPPDEFAIFHDTLATNDRNTTRRMLNFGFPEGFAHNYLSSFSKYTKQNILDIILKIYQTYFIVEALNTIYKLGSAYGIEHRHPFINYDMVDYFNGLPWDTKTVFFRRKPMIVELGKKHLPKDFFSKSKEGFGVPLDKWFYNESGMGRFVGLLEDKRTLERGIFNKVFLDKLLQLYNKKNLPVDSFESVIWPIVNVELWNRIFIDENLRGYE